MKRQNKMSRPAFQDMMDAGRANELTCTQLVQWARESGDYERAKIPRTTIYCGPSPGPCVSTSYNRCPAPVSDSCFANAVLHESKH